MFKVGQTVWCVLCGKGKVSNIDDDLDYPVIVISDSGKNSEFTY